MSRSPAKARLKKLELLPLIFAYNHVSTEVARALRVADVENVMSLQTPLNALRRKLELRGVLGHPIKLKGLETQEVLEQVRQKQGEHGGRNIN